MCIDELEDWCKNQSVAPPSVSVETSAGHGKTCSKIMPHRLGNPICGGTKDHKWHTDKGSVFYHAFESAPISREGAPQNSGMAKPYVITSEGAKLEAFVNQSLEKDSMRVTTLGRFVAETLEMWERAAKLPEMAEIRFDLAAEILRNTYSTKDTMAVSGEGGEPECSCKKPDFQHSICPVHDQSDLMGTSPAVAAQGQKDQTGAEKLLSALKGLLSCTERRGDAAKMLAVGKAQIAIEEFERVGGSPVRSLEGRELLCGNCITGECITGDHDCNRIACQCPQVWCVATRKELSAALPGSLPSPAPQTWPIELNTNQEKILKNWAEDKKNLWLTEETRLFNLRVFARTILLHSGPSLPSEETRATDLQLVNLGLRRRVHIAERHNQWFERCESAWCNPSPNDNPALESFRDVVAANRSLQEELAALRGAASPAEGPTPAAEIIAKLKEACTGHPHAKIPWPHRLLHDAIKLIEQLSEAAGPKPSPRCPKCGESNPDLVTCNSCGRKSPLAAFFTPSAGEPQPHGKETK